MFGSIGIIFMVMVLGAGADAQLCPDYYERSCGNVLDIIRPVVRNAVREEARIAASLVRLHFHDCFVNGCDGSILLDDTSSFSGEKSALPNNNSARGFDVIDAIKSEVEKSCPGVVSCADILAIAARDAVVLSKGPSWDVQLGRRDSTTASANGANANIPSPASNVSQLISMFGDQGLSVRDLVALSGAHSIGQARCVTFRDRVYNETAPINPRYAAAVERRCPASGGDDNLSPLDKGSATNFDNRYFKNLKYRRGLLHSDQVLLSSTSTASIVQSYIDNSDTFFNDFRAAMLNMGNIMPLTGDNGQIRKNCRYVNS